MSDARRPEAPDDLVETLIRAGGRRIDPPDEAYQLVYAAAESALRDKVNRRRWRRYGAWLAAAAAVGIIAVGLGVSTWRAAPPPAAVARVDRLLGTVQQHAADRRDWMALAAPDASLGRGTSLRTRAASGVGLLYPDGSSLRLGPDSEIELSSERSVTLKSGTLYAATAAQGPGRLEVLTPRGRVRHLGTQFELRYDEPVLRLRVREGRVALAADGDSFVAEAGEELTVGAAGEIERRSIARDDPDWRWSEQLAPMPRFDGRSARTLLEWAARETGRELVYADAAAEQRAATVILHGEPGPLEPATALELMLATTDLGVDVDGSGRIQVLTR